MEKAKLISIDGIQFVKMGDDNEFEVYFDTERTQMELHVGDIVEVTSDGDSKSTFTLTYRPEAPGINGLLQKLFQQYRDEVGEPLTKELADGARTYFEYELIRHTEGYNGQ